MKYWYKDFIIAHLVLINTIFVLNLEVFSSCSLQLYIESNTTFLNNWKHPINYLLEVLEIKTHCFFFPQQKQEVAGMK